MRLLIVDDSPTTISLLQGMASDWGYQVQAVSDGSEAWEILNQSDAPRLVLLDWMMPNLTGLELCERLKQAEYLPYFHVIMLSSKSEAEDAVRALDAGAVDFMSKPVKPKELRRRLDMGKRVLAMMRRRPTGPPDIDGYQIRNLLGKGGMGEVYRATQLSVDREVALKIVRCSELSPGARFRFVREVRLNGRLEHPNVVRIYDCREERDTMFYTMELVRGTDLGTYCQKREPSRRQIIGLMIQACEGVGFAHAQNIVHRDLKPRNIMVTDVGLVKVVDFGLAKAIEETETDKAEVTQAGELIGTPLYMAPEQALPDASPLSAATDVYALGVILYRLCLGRHPHKPDGSVRELVAAIANEPIRPPRQFEPHIDPKLEQILIRALSKNAADRHRDARELASELSHVYSGMS